jgi:predicted flavoprotein YhiN
MNLRMTECSQAKTSQSEIASAVAILAFGGNSMPCMPATDPAKDEGAGNKGPMVQSPLAEKWDYEAPMKKVAARFKGTVWISHRLPPIERVCSWVTN